MTRRPADTPPLDPHAAYTLWADDYPPVAHNLFMRLEEEAMRALAPPVRAKTVLDLACGSGRHLRRALEDGARVAYGIDFVAPMLFRVPRPARLVRADMRRLPLAGGTVDVILCGLAVGHVRDLTGALREMSRVLRPGGCAVYSDFHPVGRELGWQRAFRAPDGREVVVEHHFHTLADHERACRAAGLVVEDVREPLIPPSNPSAGHPAVLALRVRKPRPPEGEP